MKRNIFFVLFLAVMLTGSITIAQPTTDSSAAAAPVGVATPTGPGVAPVIPGPEAPATVPKPPTTQPDATIQAQPSAAELDLSDLKRRHQNALVKIEFTGIENQEETKMNPTKSESYVTAGEALHGSGFFISESEILTNAHVVERARAGSIRIKSPATGNVEFRAEVIGVGGSEEIDLALLRFPEDEQLRFKKRSGLSKIPFLQFGNSDTVKQADALGIFGYPQASDELKLIQAKVTGRQYLKLGLGDFISGHQFIEVGPSGVVQPGNSGGPALDSKGKVVGIPSRGSGWALEQGWLIPSNIVLHFLDRIRNNDKGNKSIQLPILGVSLTENFTGTAVWNDAPEDEVIFELGVVVREVIPNSIADDWGIKANDIIVGYANKQKNMSAALDFQGYRVTTGKMRTWPPADTAANTVGDEEDIPKLHLVEMVLMSDPGDDITFWYVRKGMNGLQTIEKKFEYKQPVPLPHLGTFGKPPFELWGDFVAQDFNDFNVPLFEVPYKQVMEGGVLVTFIEPNSLASRRGMYPRYRPGLGFNLMQQGQYATSWDIIETVNDKPVKNLAELKAAFREAESNFDAKTKEAGYDPAKRILMKERYVQIGFRTNTNEGQVLHLKPAFPIDEALECRKALGMGKDNDTTATSKAEK